MIEKVSAVFYELIKQHIFFNGNKRIATYFLLHLLALNGYMLDVDEPEELAEFAKRVATSNARDRERELEYINKQVQADLVATEAWKLFRRRRGFFWQT
ncbi:MAG TPA: type II toxin-antitoxin system death-on-curing family toxin [Thermoanaerobaculia bacterium]|nr:type II toxin-antitoxin system death-on-curing family toxin [Thermoanaerobaculia bacterium]